MTKYDAGRTRWTRGRDSESGIEDGREGELVMTGWPPSNDRGPDAGPDEMKKGRH